MLNVCPMCEESSCGATIFMLSRSCFAKGGVLGLGFKSEHFRCKEFPADLVESFLSHSPGFFLLEKLLDLISCRCCQLVSQLLEHLFLSLVFGTRCSFLESESLLGSEALCTPPKAFPNAFCFTITKYFIDKVIAQRSQSTHCRWDAYLFEQR